MQLQTSLFSNYILQLEGNGWTADEQPIDEGVIQVYT